MTNMIQVGSFFQTGGQSEGYGSLITKQLSYFLVPFKTNKSGRIFYPQFPEFETEPARLQNSLSPLGQFFQHQRRVKCQNYGMIH